ncbi:MULTISPECIES: nitrous oxide reductase accessory protein NosL [unclassified Shewanella]|uniref:nitrous oxide reductase accessory protein NosL n=1 Tax=unclassified Shewanella TaxID=196818 RepID=UPI000C84F3F1|nr:nitrous oxide reductase accessory protein NosL [Shewanella sp. 10N.286.51.B7]PMG77003.1 nitrous oxide reductase accessory protein NosL [Shewanella sp. 10N.286.51.B7]
MKKILSLLLLVPLLFACTPDKVGAEASGHSHAIHEHDRCHMCGMMITKYPGPKGQLSLKNVEVNPSFCSTRDLFSFLLQPENTRQVNQVWVHDMAKTDWDNPKDEFFIDGKTATYVYGTSRQAVMGPAVASFSTKQAAQDFAREFGGAVLKFDDITIELLGENMSHH